MAEIDMERIAPAITQARSQGYSDDQIYDFLSKNAPDQFKRAKDQGYSSGEVLNFLSPSKPQSSADQTGALPGAPNQPTVPPATPDKSAAQPLSWSDVPGQALVNAPASAGRFAGDIYQAVRHPIDTATNIGDIGLGILQKTGIVPGEEYTKYADAVGQYFSDKYGGIDNIKRALATDPVGVAGDVATLFSGGGGALARVPGVLGRLGEVTAAASRYADPMVGAGKLAKGAGYLASEAAGLPSGVGGLPLRIGAEAGYEGGPAATAFRENMRGIEPADAVVNEARGAVQQLRQQRGQDYRQGMIPIGQDKTVLNWNDVDNALTNMTNVQTYKGQVLAPKTQAIRQEIGQAIQDWKQLDPAEYHTPEGFDALKRKVGDIRDATQYGTPDRVVADQAYNAIKNTIVNQAPEYAKVMSGYEKASGVIKEIESTLSLNPGASVDTSLRKLQSVLRNNVTSAYGRREELANYLVNAGAPQLLRRLAGQSVSSWTPRSWGALVAKEAVPAAAGMLAGGVPTAALGTAATLPLMSPRLMGEAAYAAGTAARHLPLSVLGGAVEPARQTGRLSDLQRLYVSPNK